MPGDGVSRDKTRLTWTLDKSVDRLARTGYLEANQQLHNLMPEIGKLVVEFRDLGFDHTDGEVLALLAIRSIQRIHELERKQNPHVDYIPPGIEGADTDRQAGWDGPEGAEGE